MPERTPLELVMFAAWCGVPPDAIPPEYKGHLCEDTMNRWRRVADAARQHIEREAA